MIKINLEMGVKDLIELIETGLNVEAKFKKEYLQNETYIRERIRKEVSGVDRVNESFEEMQTRIKEEHRIKKEIEESKRSISDNKELGKGLADSLIRTDQRIDEEHNRDVEEAKDRIKKRIYGAQQNLKMEDIKDFKFEDLCTHKFGKDAAINNLTTEGVTCSLCNKKFKLIDRYDEETKKAINHINNVVETLRLSNVHLTEEEILELARFQSVLNTLEVKLFNKYKLVEDKKENNYKSLGVSEPISISEFDKFIK